MLKSQDRAGLDAGRGLVLGLTDVVTLPCVVEEHLDYFDTGCITFLVYARQLDAPPDKRLQKMSTRVRIYLLT